MGGGLGAESWDGHEKGGDQQPKNIKKKKREAEK
jgi:hypothetical protein